MKELLGQLWFLFGSVNSLDTVKLTLNIYNCELIQIDVSSFVYNPHLLCLTLPLFNYLLVPHEVQVNSLVLISKYDSHNRNESHDLHEYQIGKVCNIQKKTGL